MYFNQKYQERVAAQSEFEKEIEQGIDNRIQADHEDGSNYQDYGNNHPEQEFYDINEEFVERFTLHINKNQDMMLLLGLRRVRAS